MEILKKYKHKFDSGFKEFVINLDLLPPKVVKEMISNALLEDPVYLKWALDNKLNFEYFIDLKEDDVLKLLHHLKNSNIILLRALKNHPEESDFLSIKLPSLILKQYLQDRESEIVTLGHQEDARSKIMKGIFTLKERGDLSAFDWKIPPVDVLRGSSFIINNLGLCTQYYEDNILALSGNIVQGKRSGPWKFYYPSGALHIEGGYAEGLKQESWSHYFQNGKLKLSGNYKDDLKSGEWREYNSNNELAISQFSAGKKL